MKLLFLGVSSPVLAGDENSDPNPENVGFDNPHTSIYSDALLVSLVLLRILFLQVFILLATLATLLVPL